VGRTRPFDYTQLAGLNLREYEVMLFGIKVWECGCGTAPEIPNVEGLHYAIGVALITKEGPLQPSGLRFLRKSLGLTQESFAKLGHVTAEWLSKVENGHERLGEARDTQFRLAFLGQLLEVPDLTNHFEMPELRGVVQGLAARTDEIVKRLTISIEGPPAWMIKEDAGDDAIGHGCMQ
jgi:transcriptional regulator with XRE-family HTH domain